MSRIAEHFFGDRPYPESPGYRERTTSRDAAKAAASDAATLREKVFQEIAAAGARGLTADEAAMKLDRTVLACRPRVSELAHADPPRIVRTGERRSNGSRLLAAVWRGMRTDPQGETE